MLEKGVHIHYVNLAESLKGVEQLAEKISDTEAVTFDKFLRWVRKRNSYNLIILDNCDETLHSHKEELQYVVEKVIEHSLNFIFLITSREVTSYIESFEPYKLYELSKRAACDLIEKKIPFGMKVREGRAGRVDWWCPVSFADSRYVAASSRLSKPSSCYY